MKQTESNHLGNALRRISQWWEGSNGPEPLFMAVTRARGDINPNDHWQNPSNEPDFAKLVLAQKTSLESMSFFGVAYPVLEHLWGARGTPMTMAAYLGGDVKFSEATVWVDPVIEDWKDFHPRFDPDNPWVRRSRQLMAEQLRQCGKGMLVRRPGLGDALTVFSLLRGTERLLLDLLERPEVIRAKLDEFVAAWIEAHKHFWDIYRRQMPGDSCSLIWAPGQCCMVQCDFSTMISPDMFRRFVVPELEQLSHHLDYMVWHLDGPEEIKHLDILLELPYIQAIQVQPGTNRPGCGSDLWLDELKKIQQKGKALFAYANTPGEMDVLLSNLSPKGLLIAHQRPFTDPAEVRAFYQAVQHPAARGLPAGERPPAEQ